MRNLGQSKFSFFLYFYCFCVLTYFFFLQAEDRKTDAFLNILSIQKNKILTHFLVFTFALKLSDWLLRRPFKVQYKLFMFYFLLNI